jgi:Lactonase, 7-bladed beta-propeller
MIGLPRGSCRVTCESTAASFAVGVGAVAARHEIPDRRREGLGNTLLPLNGLAEARAAVLGKSRRGRVAVRRSQVGCLRSSGFGSGSWRCACLEHPVGSHDEPIKICRPRWLVDRAGSRSEHFHTRMERGIAWRRSGRLGLEALRSAIPPDGRAGERHLAMGLHRAARQWPPLRRSRPESIAAFAVDPETGHLTAAEHTPTEAVPSAFCLDPAGHFLFAASTASGRLASYRSTNRAAR